MMSKNVPTYVVEPVLRVEEESPVLDLLKQTQKRMGAGIRASTYDAGAKWLDEEALKNKPAVYTLAPGRKKELDNDLDAFLTDLGTNPNTRMVIRVALAEEDDGAVRSIKAAIRAFVEEKIGKGRVLAVNFAMEKIKVVAAVYEKPEYSNPAMDLFLDASMAELDRYGKLDGYPGKEIPDNFRLKFMELLKVSAANFDEEFRGITSIEALLNKIFSGTFLKIRKIDWESIKQWKLQNEAVLRSV
jgi:hypothetical protein